MTIELCKVLDGDGLKLGTIEVDIDKYPDGAPVMLDVRFDSGATACYEMYEMAD